MAHSDVIIGLNPTHYFPLDQRNTIADYDGSTFNGATLDVVGNIVLDSVMRPLLKLPISVDMVTSSVVTNQKLSNALLIGTELDTPYTVTHNNFNVNPDSNPAAQNTSVSFNLQVSQNNMAAYTLSNTRKVNVYIGGDYYGDAQYYGNSVVFQSPLIGFGQVYEFEFRDSVTGTILYEYTLECVFQGTPTLTTEDVFTVSNTYTSNLDNSLTIKNVYYDTQQGRQYLTKPAATVNSLLKPYFIFEHRIDIVTPQSQVVVVSRTKTKNDFLRIGGITISVSRQTISQNNTLTYLCVDNKFFGAFESTSSIQQLIQVDKPYNVVVSFDVTNGGVPNASIAKVYLNGVQVHSDQLLMSRVTHDINSTLLSIGNTYNVVGSDITLLNGYLKVQNVAIYDRVLTSSEVIQLHESAYNFIEYIKNELTPTHLYEFNVVTNTQSSSVSFATYNINSFTLVQAKARYGYDFKGIKCTGQGSIICTNSNLNTGSDFSVVLLFNTSTTSGTLISQQSKGLGMSGYTLKYTSTHAVLQVGTSVTQQPLVIPTNTDLLAVLRKTVNTYTLSIYNSLGVFVTETIFQNTPATQNYQVDCYLMSSFNSNETNKDFSLYGVYFYNYDVGIQVARAFNNTQYFSNGGVITFRNLPVPATLRVYDNNTGELLDTLHTNLAGTFEFRNLYQREVSITVYDAQSKIFGVIAPVTTGE